MSGASAAEWPVVLSFVLSLLAFVTVGVWSTRKAEASKSDYLLAGRSVGPWLTALSAVATNNSGFMFVGLIGATYAGGLSAMWIMVGWVLGDWVAWFFVHRPLRERSEANGALSFPAFLAIDDRGVKHAGVALVASLVIVVFLGAYAAAQLNAGSKALHVLFGWPYATGAVLGAVIIVLYCFSGGIRASIWTDAAQSVVMLVSIAILTGTALYHAGGLAGLWADLAAQDTALTAWRPQAEDARFGFSPWLLGWLGAGLGVVGQPHVMVRAMALKEPSDMAKVRRIYVVSYSIFTVLCVLAGLCCRVLLTEQQGFDAELALPTLSRALLPAAFVGLMLAGLFSATMSTADSQVLVCSAALSQDVLPKEMSGYLWTKLATLAVAAVALSIALFGSDNVFALVTLAWSVLASALGPLLVVRSLGRPVAPRWAILMMLVGVAASTFWRFGLAWHDAVYDVLPGMLAGFFVYLVSQLWPAPASASSSFSA